MNLPGAFLEQMKQQLGDDFDRFLASYEETPSVGLRANMQKNYRPGEGFAPVPWCEGGYYVPNGLRMGKHPLHAAGAYYLQEPSAMSPVSALQVQPGMRVLDLCAAPGGKSTQIADALRGEGLLVANEIHPTRARILLENIERMGVKNAVVLGETPARIAKHFGAWFDCVLVDAPCSGEGMFRRDVIARQEWTADSPEQCHVRQMEILESAAKCVKGGGALVYSTCTYNSRENEETIAEFLQNNSEFSLDESLLLPGLPVKSGMAHLYPHEIRGEGHFLARLVKSGTEENELPALPAEKPDARWLSFAKENLVGWEKAPVFSQGEWLYALPAGAPQLKGLKVLRCGVQLGKLAAGRLEPAHALALALLPGEWKRSVSVNEEVALTYLHGETFSGELSGWGVILLDGFVLGWGKGSSGQIKNHYPKGLRRN